MLAALGVFGTGTLWPDVVVAEFTASLAIYAGLQVVQQANRELASARHPQEHVMHTKHEGAI
jgi:hypothetical protein